MAISNASWKERRLAKHQAPRYPGRPYGRVPRRELETIINSNEPGKATDNDFQGVWGGIICLQQAALFTSKRRAVRKTGLLLVLHWGAMVFSTRLFYNRKLAKRLSEKTKAGHPPSLFPSRENEGRGTTARTSRPK